MKTKTEVHEVNYYCVLRYLGNVLVCHARSPDILAIRMLSKTVPGSKVESMTAREINRLVKP